MDLLKNYAKTIKKICEENENEFEYFFELLLILLLFFGAFKRFV